MLGISFIILGILAIGASTATTILSVIFLGTLLTVGGCLQIGSTFWMHGWAGVFTSLFAGIIYAVAGIFLLLHPIAGAISLTLFLSLFYIIGGLIRAGSSLVLRFEQWGWAFFSGIIKLVLGVLILQGWPQTGLWVLGLFIGIDFVFFGLFWVMLALNRSKDQSHIS